MIDSSTDYVDDKKVISLLNRQRRIENVLKRLKLTNYRKFSSEKNIVEFISSKIVLNQDNYDINDNIEENSVQNNCDEIDVASDTTLIIGKIMQVKQQ